MKRCALSIATLLVFLQFVQSIDAQDKMNENRFQELMTTIVPDEKFRQIEWQPDLLLAQKISLEQKKPMFIWSMDGNPLGCT